MMVSDLQKRTLIRAATLIGRYGPALAPFEAELVQSCVDRYRKDGDRTTLTANEWRVLEEAVGGMDAAQEDARRAAVNEALRAVA